MKLEINSIDIHKSQCAGQFCDRQGIGKATQAVHSCGCYALPIRISNVCIGFNFEVNDGVSTLFEMQDFTSLRFLSLFLRNDGSVLPHLHQNVRDTIDEDTFDDLYDAVIDCNTFINQHGGYTIFGWMKRGEVNDLQDSEGANVLAEEINYHVVSMIPTRLGLRKQASYLRHRFSVSQLN